jgi:cytidylate kinase
MSVSIDTLLRDLRERDARDSARSVAPLQKCADAELLDTTAMTVEEAVERVVERARQCLPHAAARP